ncbi:MAG: hypothetical protein FDZ75_05250, partial [Actinobacteria bacterium]
MGRALKVMFAVLLAAAMIAPVAGCSSSSSGSSSQPSAPSQTSSTEELDAALNSASQAVGQASTYVAGLQQPLPEGAPKNEDLQQLQTTLNAAIAETDPVKKEKLAQEALDQLNAAIETATTIMEAQPAGSAEQAQLQQVIDL